MDSLKLVASKIKLIAFDVDGVLTNGDLYYSERGEELKTFNVKDGQGINMIRVEGIKTAIITARSTPIIELRARDLGILHVYMGSKNKIVSMQDLIGIYNFDFSEIAYVGDDLPDICILEKVGLACCPVDAVDEVKKICHFVSSKEGGRGAVREITDFIISAKRELKSLQLANEV